MNGTFGVRVDVDSVNGRADGAVRLVGNSGETLHAHTGNWLSDPVRNRFATECAVILHPVPTGKAESDVADDRKQTSDRVKTMVLRELDTIEKENEQTAAQPKPATESPLASLAIGGEFPLTDTGNGECLMKEHGNHLRFIARWNKPIIFSGTHWKIDEDGGAYRLAVATVRGWKQKAAAMPEEDKHVALKLFKHAHSTEAHKRLRDMIEMAGKVKGASLMPDQLDANPMLLNTRSGTINLKTGELRPHRRGDLITKVCPVDYDPTATCPTFLAFLDRIFEANGRLIAFVRRMIGYTLTGMTGERCLFILYGSGANGKSTLLSVLRDLLADYAMQTPADTLMAKQNEGIPNDIARLKGARLVSAVESDQGRRLAEAMVKRMTGGEDVISARFMRAEWFDFKPEFKLYIATNHLPDIRGTDNGIWDRIRLIPFSVTIPAEERDQTLSARLKAELSGILAWAVQGCLEWQRDGLGAPMEVASATKEYREEMDRLGDFIADNCLQAPNAQAGAAQLYDLYKIWCQLNGEEPLNQTRFGRKLGDKGFRSDRDNAGRRKWIGIGVLNSPE